MKEFVNFFHEIGKLNRFPRRGWILIGIKDPGTVADHLNPGGLGQKK